MKNDFILQNQKQLRGVPLRKYTYKNKNKQTPLGSAHRQTTEIPQTASPAPPQSLCPVSDWTRRLLLGVGDLHGAGRRDPEALQRVLGHARLSVAFKLHEGDVVFPRHESHFFETRKPAGEKQTLKHQEAEYVQISDVWKLCWM